MQKLTWPLLMRHLPVNWEFTCGVPEYGFRQHGVLDYPRERSSASTDADVL